MPLLSIPLNYRSPSLFILNYNNLCKRNCYTFIFNYAISNFMKSSHIAFTLTKAYLSRGVVCKLTMMSFPFLPTIFGISAAGVTVSELPIAKQMSAFYPSSNDFVSSY